DTRPTNWLPNHSVPVSKHTKARVTSRCFRFFMYAGYLPLWNERQWIITKCSATHNSRCAPARIHLALEVGLRDNELRPAGGGAEALPPGAEVRGRRDGASAAAPQPDRILPRASAERHAQPSGALESGYGVLSREAPGGFRAYR